MRSPWIVPKTFIPERGREHMERKNLMITGLALSALVLFCTLIVLHGKPEPARGEVSVLATDRLSHLNAATVKFTTFEALVIVDRDTHILRVFSFPNRQPVQIQGGQVDLFELFKTLPIKKDKVK
jgi:hypothetical protein